jgi:hypothetical protein
MGGELVFLASTNKPLVKPYHYESINFNQPLR